MIHAQGHILSPSEFEVLLGDSWEGHLTYLDYSSDQETKIKVNLEVEKVLDGEYKFNYTYPDEPKANSKVKMKIGKNHMTLNKHSIVSRQKLANGTLIFETKNDGKDNKKAATIFQSYEISPQEFSITKKVKYIDDDKPIMRNKYQLKR